MSRIDDAWNDVGEQFKKLGSLLREHYDEHGVDEALDVSDEAVEDAVRDVGDGIRAAVRAIGDSIKDPEVTAEMRDAAGSLFAALGVTFSEIGSQVRAPRDRSGGEDDPLDEQAPADAAGEDDTEGGFDDDE